MKNYKPYPGAIAAIAFIFFSNIVLAQSPPPPDYTFTAPSLVSGTLNAVGSVYRFAAVKPGVDALVTITGASNASVATLDQTGQGWGAAFQPNITVTSMTTGYVDFRIDFVVAGGGTAFPQAQVAITALDIDGYNFSANQRLYEFEQFNMGAGTYTDFEFAGSDISISFPGTAVRATNVAGIDYGSINLSPNVRFTVFNSNVSSVTVRSGAINQDQFNNVTRQRSFYFARFTYPNSALLPAADLKDFNAGLQQGAVKLSWQLAKDHSLQKIDIERSSASDGFAVINSIADPHAGISAFMDQSAAKGVNNYRLKLYEQNGKIAYSKTIRFDHVGQAPTGITVPTLVRSNKCRIFIPATQKSTATLLLTDIAGRVYLARTVALSAGDNVIDADIERNMPTGYYFIHVKTATLLHTAKIFVRR